MKKSRAVVVIVLVLACLLGLGYSATKVVSATAKKSDDSMKLGLDLSGGVSITYQIVNDNPSEKDVNDTISKMEQRAATYTTEYSVYRVGSDRITVEIPGVYDANEVLTKLGSPGSLYFISQKNKDGKENYSADSSSADGYKLNFDIETLVEDGSVVMTGNDVKTANEEINNNTTLTSQKYYVSLTLTDEGAQKFATATESAAAKNETIAIYYDGTFISVPSVNEKIGDGHAQITGNFTLDSAKELATKIRIGAINLKLEELESKVVGASLGTEALKNSTIAAIIGLLLVMVFMIAMYGISGVAADIALAIYTTLVVTIIHAFEITLTLPGIAGVILGIGMAVDANVIIFARIREEIASGKNVSASINEGYKKALSAILDGNITTFIAALVLILLGSGTVKGFAYTLMISILVSMFTALFVAKYVMKALYALGLKSEKLYGRAKEHKPINFMKHKAVYFAISLIIIVAGFVGMGVYGAKTGNSLNFGIEFAGGTSTTVTMDKEYTVAEIDEKVSPVVQKVVNTPVQATTIDGTTQIVLKTRTLTQEEREAVNKALVEEFKVDEKEIESQSISSTISGEMRQKAITAVLAACVCMLIYIWVRFKDIRFATSAIAALVHDVLVVLAAYALIRISVGNSFIACMLTIVGYSINDTIVVFDRIRENMHGIEVRTREDLEAVANKSLTQTLSRTINTSITTFIMVLLLFILGVPAIREFSLPLMVGLICGSYSSIFIATELWFVMKLHLGKNRVLKKS